MIGDIITAALPLLRAQAESLMTDTCTIERLTSGWDEAQQKTVTTWSLVFTGPCYMSAPAAAARSLLPSGDVASQDFPEVRTLHDAAGIEPDDRVTHSSGAVMWVVDVVPDPYPVETVIRCRWVK